MIQYLWIALKTENSKHVRLPFFLYGSHTLFMGPTSTDFSKFFFKIGFHGTIYSFKNYFAIMFSVFSNKWYPNKPSVSINNDKP